MRPVERDADSWSRAQAHRVRSWRGQHSRVFVTEPLPSTIERDDYTPALLGLLSNVLVWGGSRVFHHLHGVGTNEWRILSALGNHPGATSGELCEILGINKSIASKSVNVLLDRDLISSSTARADHAISSSPPRVPACTTS